MHPRLCLFCALLLLKEADHAAVAAGAAELRPQRSACFQFLHGPRQGRGVQGRDPCGHALIGLLAAIHRQAQCRSIASLEGPRPLLGLGSEGGQRCADGVYRFRIQP